MKHANHHAMGKIRKMKSAAFFLFIAIFFAFQAIPGLGKEKTLQLSAEEAGFLGLLHSFQSSPWFRKKIYIDLLQMKARVDDLFQSSDNSS